MATCRTAYHGHHEGWGPVSKSREFDLTPCFEEGVLLSTLLVVLLVVSLFRLWGIKPDPVGRINALTTRSASILKGKLVCFVVAPASLSSHLTKDFSLRKFRFCSGQLSQSAWQTSPTLYLVISAFRSSSLTSSNPSPYFPPSSSLTLISNEPGHPPQPFYFSGPLTWSPSLFGGAPSSLSILRTSPKSSFHWRSDPQS